MLARGVRVKVYQKATRAGLTRVEMVFGHCDQIHLPKSEISDKIRLSLSTIAKGEFTYHAGFMNSAM